MPEQLQKIIDRFVEWWKKFNNKQRAVIISITAVVILALALLGVVVSQPDYVTIYTASTMKEASEISDLLKDNGIEFQTTNAGMTFQVDKKQEADGDQEPEQREEHDRRGGSFLLVAVYPSVGEQM